VGQAGIDYAGQWNYPRFRATLTTSYSIDKFIFGANTNFISRSEYSATAASNETYQYPYVPAYITSDLSMKYRANDRYTFSLGVRNVNNAGVFVALQSNAVSPHQTGGTSTGNAYYDPIGRYFFAKFDLKL
jgi:outer membrane receptor protein involved in Fe transport